MSDEIIGFVVERIVDLVAEEVNLLKSAKNEFVSLQNELEMLQSFLIDADAKLECGDQRLRTIVKQIREMAYEAENLIDSFLQKDDMEAKAKFSFLKRIISFCSCLVQTHQMGNEVEELKSRIRQTTERLQTFQIRMDVEVIRRERPKSYPHSIGDENIVGFNDDMAILSKKLIDQDYKILAIVGMGGSGKTTMARKIYNHAEICRRFECKAWVSISQIWNQESLLKEILRQTTGQTGENLTEQATVQEIQKLLKEKSYLIVLDDVWEQDVLRRIMVPIATSHGSKFLITTRIREIIQFPDLGCYVQKPRRLTPDESWDLFQKIAFGRQSNLIMGHESEPYVVLGKEMLRKCDGLPLAVVSLGGLLSTKNNIHEWKRVQSNVISRIIEERVGPSEYGRVEDMLELSYSDLNHTLKSCFKYLGLFPEDENISTTLLMQCWIAEGFFKSVHLAAIEDVAKQHLDELIQRCLVQVEEVDYAEAAEVIRVHDLMRDLAIKRGKQVCFLDTVPSSTWTNDQTSSVSGTTILQPRRLAIIARNMKDVLEGEEERKGSRRVRSLFVYVPDLELSLKNVWTSYPLLRVLILKCLLTEIPNEIGNLIHLRLFHISYRSSSTIHLPDSIKNLRNLLTFHIERRVHGPPINLKQMKQLRFLRIPFWEFDSVDGDKEQLNLHYLPNLKVLIIRAGSWMMTGLKHLSQTVEVLSISKIQNSEQLKMVYECPSIVQDRLISLDLDFYNGDFQVQKLQHCNKLQKLVLNGVIGAKRIPLVFPPYLLKLVLWRSKIQKQDSFVSALVRLPYLKDLILSEKAYVGTELKFPQNSLLHLHKLTLWHLENLEEIQVKEGAMPHLNYIKIRACHKLKVLPQRLERLKA